jgi:DNA-binding CsgD family transcriptional regulator
MRARADLGQQYCYALKFLRRNPSIAKLLGVSPGTLYNHIPDLRELRAGGVPHQLEVHTR